MHSLRILGISVAALFAASTVHAEDYDIVVYGGTGAAVTAAVQAKKMIQWRAGIYGYG
jgi:hypothetical protein